MCLKTQAESLLADTGNYENPAIDVTAISFCSLQGWVSAALTKRKSNFKH